MPDDKIILEFDSDLSGINDSVKALRILGQLTEEQEKQLLSLGNKTTESAKKQSTEYRKTTSELGKFNDNLKKTTQTLAGGAIQQASKGLADYATATQKASGGLSQLQKKIREVEQINQEFKVELQQSKQLLDTYGNAFSPQALKLKSDIKQLESAIEDNNLALKGLKIDEKNLKSGEQGVVRLTTQLRNLKNQIATLDEGSAEFQKLSIEAARLEDKIGDVNQRIRVLSSDTFAIDAVVDSVRGITGAFTAAQGAAALFGDESEDLQKALLKVQGATALLLGVQEVANQVTGQGPAKLAALSIAQGVYSVVVGTSTGALKAFRIALAATGIGLVIVAIGLLIANWDKLKVALGGVSEEQKSLNKTRKEGLATYTQESTSVRLLIAEYQKENTTKERRNEIIDELKKTAPGYFGQLDTEKSKVEDLQLAYEKYAKALIIKGTIEALSKKISENNVKILEEENKKVGENISSIEALFRFYSGIGGTAEASLRKTTEATSGLRGENELLTDEVTTLIEQLNTLGGDPFKKSVESLDKFREATKEFTKELQQQVNEDLTFGLEDFEKAFDNKVTIPVEFDIPEENLDEPEANFRALLAQRQLDLEKNRDAGLVTEQDFAAKSRAIQEELLQFEIDSAATGSEERIAAERRLLDFKRESAEEQKAIQQEISDFALESFEQVFSFIGEIQAQQRQVDLDNKLADLETEKQAQLTAAGDNAKKREQIEARFRKQEKLLKREAFEEDKQARIQEAIMNGAAAVIKSIATLGPPVPPNVPGILGVASAILLTGINIARIAATPPPRFAKGTKKAPAGMKLVGEEGPELINDAGGYEIIPHKRTVEILNSFENPAKARQIITERGFGFDYKRLGEEIAKYPRFRFEVNENGLMSFIESDKDHRQYLNKRHSF